MKGGGGEPYFDILLYLQLCNELTRMKISKFTYSYSALSVHTVPMDPGRQSVRVHPRRRNT